MPDESIIKNSFAIPNWWLHILPCPTVEDLHDFVDFAAQHKIQLYLYINQALLHFIEPTIRKYNLPIEYVFQSSTGNAFDVVQVIDDCHSELSKIKRGDLWFLCNNKMAFGHDQSNVYVILNSQKMKTYDLMHQLKKIMVDAVDEDE